jgi:Flp pilus assembly protein TadG
MIETMAHHAHTPANSIEVAPVSSIRHRRRRNTSCWIAEQIMKGGRGFWQLFVDKKGTAAIEFGMVAVFLSFLLLGLIDFGMGYWEQMQVGNAARAGGDYATIKGWDQSGIASAVTSATGLSSITATPAPTQSCGCPSVSAGITTENCGSSCAGGDIAGTYVTVNAKASYSTIFTYPGIANPLTLTASMIVRIN